MTILSINYVPRIRNTNLLKLVLHLECDQCGKHFLKQKGATLSIKSNLHFCCKKCQYMSLSDTESKVSKKIKETQITKYGGYFVGTKKFQDDQKTFCLEKYGVESRLESPQILEKIKQTCIEKYGKETYVGSDDHKSKMDFKEVAAKAWETKIKNGTCSKSKPEEKVYTILVNELGENDVIRQCKVLRQWVDFYIKSLDLYIQCDGVYWHGKNRKLATIKLQKTTQDKKIYNQILRDRKLNKYMKKNNMKLVRITDDEINEWTDQKILEVIKGK